MIRLPLISRFKHFRTSAQSTNILFLLPTKELGSLLEPVVEKPERLPTTLPHYKVRYSGEVSPFKEIARMLWQTDEKLSREKWNAGAKIAVYAYSPEERALTIALQSISCPKQFCSARIDGNLFFNAEGIMRSRFNELRGTFSHYMGMADRLAVFTHDDTLEKFGSSPWNYLFKEACACTKSVTIASPESIIECPAPLFL